MATLKRTVTMYRCDQCGHTWLPRKPTPPKICPVCKRNLKTGRR